MYITWNQIISLIQIILGMHIYQQFACNFENGR